ncbi:MAG: Na(+)-translocating NADH-quinone reductase subunit C [Pseudomonadales bacterium]
MSESSDLNKPSSDKKFDKEGLKNVLFVAISVCLVCSVVVATSAVLLKPMRILNQELDQKQNILRAAGLLPERAKVDELGRGIEELFSEFEVRAVDLNTGEFVDSVDVTTYDPIKASKRTEDSMDLTSDQDIAVIGRRENVSLVYLKIRDGVLDKVVIPVRGYGLWGTLLGYLALESDMETIAGLGFYFHKETPGLGGEVDNPKWKRLWRDVKAFDEAGLPAVRLVKTRSASGSEAARHEVDALSGATLTSRGVQNLVRFWTGELGFGSVLKNLKTAS